MFFVSDTLRQYPEIAIFLTLALGFWFGSLKFRSFSLGAVTSTLLAGLLVGQLHISIPPVVQSTFFLMFLFAVGYGVGPQFFRTLKKDGLPQVAFALLVCATGLLCAYVLGKMLGFGPGLTAGLLLSGIVVSIVPLAVGLLAGKYIFKLHPAITLGACAGARSATAAMGALQEATNSPIPAIGYTIPYAVSRIVLAICGVIIVLLMK